ncbi:MAG: WD40/YVTN/BNR-like repeat-containing protein [Limnohabitans sp.]
MRAQTCWMQMDAAPYFLLLELNFNAMLYTASRRALLLTLLSLVAACGGRGGPADPPAGFTVTAGDGQVVVRWDMTAGVDYWLPYAPQAAFNSPDFTTTSGLRWVTQVTSPYVLTGLTNGQTYTFALNGRTGSGKGGDLTVPVTLAPRVAGSVWQTGGVLTGAVRGITWGAASDTVSYYLAAGDGGALYKSTNDGTSSGLSWTPITGSGLTSPLNAAIYTLSKFIVVGNGGTVSSSADLATWTTSTLSGTPKLNALASNGSRVVAVGDGGTIAYSADGVNWNLATVPVSVDLYGVTYASSGTWLAVGAGGTLLTSSDGMTWTAQTSGVLTDLRGAAYRAATTVTTTIPAATTTTPAAYVLVGAGGVVLHSTDAVNWTPKDSKTAGSDLMAVSSLPNQFLAVGASGAVAASADGLIWTASTMTGGSNMYGLNNARGQYVAVGASGANYYSR